MPLPKPGDILLGKYEVLRSLGEGGMGVVFSAHHRELDERVAIKFLHPHLAARADVASRFLQEARAGRRIKSQHVARVFDVARVDDAPFMVMDLLEGETLAAYLDRRGPLPTSEAVDLLLQACEAVNEAHILGIVHRDIKPGNLFLTLAPNGAPFLRVLDFGISKFENVNVTASANMLGTPLYMSPEQAKDAPNVDARADIWSLGVVLYEMLSGTRPFAGSSGSAILIAVLQNAHAKLSTLLPDVPPFLEQAVDRALAKEPTDRFESIEELAAAIVQFGTAAGGASLTQIQQYVARSLPAPAESHALVPSSGGPSTAPGRETDASGTESVDTDARLLAARGPASQALTPVPAVPKSVARPRLTPALGATVAAVAVVGALVARFVVPTAASTTAATSAQSALAAPSTEATPSASSSAPPAPSDSSPPAAVVASSASPAPFARSTPAATNACTNGATPSCEAACKADAAGACHALARALEHGDGAPADPARAAKLYEAECDAGGMPGCNNLAALYSTGAGVPHDDQRAVALYKQACDHDNALSCANLGSMHYDGTGIPQNYDLGVRLFGRACDKGEPSGCFSLSGAYADGHGVPKDVDQAFTYAQKACVGGMSRGCVRVAKARIVGSGVEKDAKAGLAQLDAMCKGHDAGACRELASIYAKGYGDVPADPVRVSQYLQSANARGDKESGQADRLLATRDRTGTTPAQANEQWQTQCDNGQMFACAMRGEALMNGRGGPADPVKGAELLAKACQGGVKSACGGVGSGGR
jgi:serine/threonine protein kinase/TPR repeat protein